MRIKAYATLRDLLGASVMEVPLTEPTDVEYVLRHLVADCPAFGKKLWHDDGRTTGYVTILLNGRSVEYLAGMATPVTEGDTIALFPPVGGG
jgi:molybdopterin synthase sulfur carrier subunit